MKFIAGLALALAAVTAPTYAQEAASTGDVTVTFAGASGKMKMFVGGTNAESEAPKFMMISQAKLEEVGADDKPCAGCFKMNVAGQNSWELTEEKDGETTTHTAVFSVTEKGATFGLTAVISNLQTKIADDYAPCDTGSGACYKETTVDTTTTTDCAAPVEGSCADGYTLNEIDLTANDLKFSIDVSGISFKDPANKLKYGIIVQDKSGSTAPTVTDGKVSFPDGDIGYVNKCLIEGTGSTEADVDVTSYEQGGKFYMDFVFPSFGDEESLHYDPDMTVNAGSSAYATSGVTIALSALFAGAMAMMF